MRSDLSAVSFPQAVTCSEVNVKGPSSASRPSGQSPLDSVGLLSGIRGLLVGKNAFFQRPLLALGNVAKAVGQGADQLAAQVTNQGLLGLKVASHSLLEPYKKASTPTKPSPGAGVGL